MGEVKRAGDDTVDGVDIGHEAGGAETGELLGDEDFVEEEGLEVCECCTPDSAEGGVGEGFVEEGHFGFHGLEMVRWVTFRCWYTRGRFEDLPEVEHLARM